MKKIVKICVLFLHKYLHKRPWILSLGMLSLKYHTIWPFTEAVS